MTLSKRQTKLLDLISGGLSVKEAAQRIGIKPSTAKGYMRVVHYKLGSKSQSHAVALWVMGRRCRER